MKTIYLTPEQVKRLTALSAKTRIPYSVFVREAVEGWLPDAERRAEGPPERFLQHWPRGGS